MSASALDNYGVASFSHIPLELLQAELVRRQQEEAAPNQPTGTPKPECGTKGQQSEYNTGSHIFALILILVLSTVACAFPIVARRFPKLPIPHHFLFLSRHFGTGVLIATAFVHLLPTAFHSLSNPCLPDFWIKGYKAMPGLVAMIAVFAVVGIEMFFAAQGAGHIHGSEFDTLPPEPEVPGAGEMHFGGHKTETRYGRGSRPRGFSDYEGAPEDHGDDLGTAGAQWAAREEQLHSSGDTIGANGYAKTTALGFDENHNGDDDDEEEDEDGDLALEMDELDPNTNTEDDADLLAGSRREKHTGSRSSSLSATRRKPEHRRNISHRSTLSTSSTTAPSPQLARRLLLQCALLEAGILFHSVFIGMAVSVSTGSAFVVLLMAIAFHQTFEGLALGARIASIVPLLPPGSIRPWIMTLAFGITTPIGQAIGLSIHTLYDPRSEVGLILVGCMNAISSGLLLFAGLVELLAEDFLSEGSYKALKGKRRLEACACVILGAFLMALIGAWA